VHTTRWAALQRGEIDCAPQPAPWNFLAERQGYRRIGEVNDVLPEIIFAGVIATAGWTARNRYTVRSLLAALAEAHDIVNDPANDAVTLPIYQRLTTPDDPDLAGRGLSYTRDLGMWPKNLAVAPNALAATVDAMIRAGLLAPELRAAAAGVLDPSFVPVS